MLASEKHPYLLCAFGNKSLSDDGASIFALESIKRKQPKLADYKDYLYMDANFINEIEGYEKVIIFDTTKSNKMKIGDFAVCDLSKFKESFHLCNFHDSSIKEIVEMGKILGMNMPKDVFIFTIEIKENKLFSTKFSHELERRIWISIIEMEKQVLKLI
jgi:hydrogenase maturation protease